MLDELLGRKLKDGEVERGTLEGRGCGEVNCGALEGRGCGTLEELLGAKPVLLEASDVLRFLSGMAFSFGFGSSA